MSGLVSIVAPSTRIDSAAERAHRMTGTATNSAHVPSPAPAAQATRRPSIVRAISPPPTPTTVPLPSNPKTTGSGFLIS